MPLFYRDENGKKQDASLHAEILNGGDHEAALEVSRRRLRKMGLDPDVLIPRAGEQKRFDPSQPRDETGEWTSGGGGDGSSESGAASPSKPVDPGKESKLLSEDEQKSILFYQGSEGFSKINNSLRAGNPPGEHAKRLSSAIGKHRLIDTATVYRGVGNTLSKKLDDLWRDKEPGDPPITFVDKGFVSTSMSQKIAETFSKNTIKIKLPKGHNVLPIVDREHAHEAELLIDKGTKFKVLSMRKTASGYRRFEVEIVL